MMGFTNLGRSLLSTMMAMNPQGTVQATFTFYGAESYDVDTGLTTATTTQQTLTVMRKVDDDRKTKEDEVQESAIVIVFPDGLLQSEPTHSTMVRLTEQDGSIQDYAIVDSRRDTASVNRKFYLQEV